MNIMSMELKIRLPYPLSLKEKRSTVKSILSKIKRRYNVSIIENDDHDDLKWVSLMLVVVSLNNTKANLILDNIIEFIEYNYSLEIVEIYKEQR